MTAIDAVLILGGVILAITAVGLGVWLWEDRRRGRYLAELEMLRNRHPVSDLRRSLDPDYQPPEPDGVDWSAVEREAGR